MLEVVKGHPLERPISMRIQPECTDASSMGAMRAVFDIDAWSIGARYDEWIRVEAPAGASMGSNPVRSREVRLIRVAPANQDEPIGTNRTRSTTLPVTVTASLVNGGLVHDLRRRRSDR